MVKNFLQHINELYSKTVNDIINNKSIIVYSEIYKTLAN